MSPTFSGFCYGVWRFTCICVWMASLSLLLTCRLLHVAASSPPPHPTPPLPPPPPPYLEDTKTFFFCCSSILPKNQHCLVSFLYWCRELVSSCLHIYLLCKYDFETWIIAGSEGFAQWLEDPSYPNTTLSWNIIHGTEMWKKKIEKKCVTV